MSSKASSQSSARIYNSFLRSIAFAGYAGASHIVPSEYSTCIVGVSRESDRKISTCNAGLNFFNFKEPICLANSKAAVALGSQ